MRITTLSAKPLGKVSRLVRVRQGIMGGGGKGSLPLGCQTKGVEISLAYLATGVLPVKHFCQ
jgi:hypothetical protein